MSIQPRPEFRSRRKIVAILIVGALMWAAAVALGIWAIASLEAKEATLWV